MKFRIRNEFSKKSINDGCWSVTPFDYNKFKNGQIVELNTEKELYEFMSEAQHTINYVGNHLPWDWIDKVIRINPKTHEIEICIYHMSAD